MAFTPTTIRNRVNPIVVSNEEQVPAPYVTYDEVELCNDPNCPVCRAQRRDKRQKHRHRHHHHKRRRHRRKRKSSFWNSFVPRADSVSSTLSMHSIEFDTRRPRYSAQVTTERAVVPVNQTEQQVVSSTTRTTATRPIDEEEVVREAWVR